MEAIFFEYGGRRRGLKYAPLSPRWATPPLVIKLSRLPIHYQLLHPQCFCYLLIILILRVVWSLNCKVVMAPRLLISIELSP